MEGTITWLADIQEARETSQAERGVKSLQSGSINTGLAVRGMFRKMIMDVQGR